MDHKLCGLLRHCVLVHAILQFHWSLVSSAPARAGCNDLDNAKSITALLGEDTLDLLNAYNQFHRAEDFAIRPDVPSATVTGDTVSERLRAVYARSALLLLHILKVKEYQAVYGGDETIVGAKLAAVEIRLGHHLVKVKAVLQNFYPEAPLPPMPAPPQISANHLYPQKEYGWGVIVTLRDWPAQVLQVLEETGSLCD